VKVAIIHIVLFHIYDQKAFYPFHCVGLLSAEYSGHWQQLMTREMHPRASNLRCVVSIYVRLNRIFSTERPSIWLTNNWNHANNCFRQQIVTALPRITYNDNQLSVCRVVQLSASGSTLSYGRPFVCTWNRAVNLKFWKTSCFSIFRDLEKPKLYLNTQLVPHSKHTLSYNKTSNVRIT